MADEFFLTINIAMTIYAILAAIIFWFSWRKRSDILFIFIGAIVYSIGHTFLIFKHFNDFFSFIGNGVILLALIIVIFGIIIDYWKLIVKSRKENVIFIISFAITIIVATVSIILFNIFHLLDILNAIMLPMIALLSLSIYFITRIYQKEQTITRLSTTFTLITATLTASSAILAVYFDWGLALNIILSFIFQTFIMIIGLAAIVEERITHSEEKYRLLSEQLEEKVIDRTKQLETVNTELETFSYSVSHDLRSPLRSISGFANILQKEFALELGEEGRSYIKRIMANTNRMSELINDLLDLAHISRSDLFPEMINLSEIANEIMTNLKQINPGRNIDFVVEEEMLAKCDAKLIRIVLENLLSNAVKFTKNIECAKICFEMIEQDNEIAFSIRDNGVGFDMAYNEKLFGLFQRLHSSEEFEGTGVGLVTVKRIIDRHLGKIWAEAKVDEGATFYFRL